MDIDPAARVPGGVAAVPVAQSVANMDQQAVEKLGPEFGLGYQIIVEAIDNALREECDRQAVRIADLEAQNAELRRVVWLLMWNPGQVVRQ